MHILFRPSGALKAILLSLPLYALQTAKQGKNARKAKNEQGEPHKKGGWGLKNEFSEGQTPVSNQTDPYCEQTDAPGPKYLPLRFTGPFLSS